MLAPTLPVVYRYRANVAYLMDDLPAVVSALESGLELEPGNLLLRENLTRVRSKMAKSTQ